MKSTKRLDWILTNVGIGTRKDVRNYIKKGQVKINDNIEKDCSKHFDPYEIKIRFNGKDYRYTEFAYFMMNKPAGYISATFDEKLPTVLTLMTEEIQRKEVFPIGRLDIDTEGLLVISNNGDLAHKVLSPKKHVSKKYYVKVDGKICDEDIQKFKEGIVLNDGYKTLPSELEIIDSDECVEAVVTIYEGKFHQIKRMFADCGKKVVYLKRIQMGNLKLDNSLKIGEYRELNEKELNLLMEVEG